MSELMCDGCKIREAAHVCSSRFGPFSHAMCLKCYEAGLEPISSLMIYFSMSERSFPECSLRIQYIIMKSLFFYAKTVAEFIADTETFVLELNRGKPKEPGWFWREGGNKC